MLEIRRVNGPTESTPVEREGAPRREPVETPAAPVQDSLEISLEGQQASNILKFTEVARNLPDVRNERIEAARANLERGAYREPEVVREVADRLYRYIMNE